MQTNIYALVAEIKTQIADLRLAAKRDRELLQQILTGLAVVQSSDIEILADLDILLEAIEPPAPAATMLITWGTPSPPSSVAAPQTRNRFFQENLMSVTLNPGQTVPFNCSPLNASLAPSLATLSNLAFVSSDVTVFTVAPDPANPTGGIVTALTPAVMPDSAALSASATATEPDGVTTEQISGTDTVLVQSVTPPPPPPPVAGSLLITWGVPSSKK